MARRTTVSVCLIRVSQFSGGCVSAISAVRSACLSCLSQSEKKAENIQKTLDLQTTEFGRLRKENDKLKSQ